MKEHRDLFASLLIGFSLSAAAQFLVLPKLYSISEPVSAETVVQEDWFETDML